MQPEFFEVGSGAAARSIAVRRRVAALASPGVVRPGVIRPGVVWLGGYRSDMTGGKAQAVDAWCASQGLACCRFDYSGHGESGGAFADGTISRWLEESLCVFDRFTAGPQILVGSSMGCWIALRMAQELAGSGGGARLAAMVLIAPAPDFTERLIWPQLSQAQKQQIEATGRLEEPSDYSPEPDVYTRALFEDGRANLVMDGELRTFCPVHIVQGRLDPDVPWRHAVELAGLIASDDVTMTLVPDGDHRLSRPQDIALILRALDRLASAPPPADGQ